MPDIEADKIDDTSANEVADDIGEIIDKLDRLDEKDHTISKVIASRFSGPIPPPNVLKDYEEVIPGSADRIISMAEMQLHHRMTMESSDRELEKTNMMKSFNYSKTGLVFGGILATVLILGCIYLVSIDKTIEGFAVLSPIVISLITLSVKSTHKKDNDRQHSANNEEADDDTVLEDD